jgi:hypothetical protein
MYRPWDATEITKKSTGNLSDFRFWFGIDTAKNTRSKRWRLRE